MLEPGSHIEKYEVLSALGSGAMARVCKVRHTILGSLHAMKVLDPLLVRDPDLNARFLAEGRIQAQLRHPNLVAVTDIIARPDIAGLVADFIEGPTLESAIRDRRSSPMPDEIKAVFLPLLDGLAYAHARGIVHRDIKPSNIVLDQGRPEQMVPRLIDFGIAKITESSLGPHAAKGKTRTGDRMGTLHYMSPEQIQGLTDVDARADIFSMAVTLFEFISGQVPFDADSDFNTMKQIVEGHPTPIRDLRPDVDPILEACVIKGLAQDRENRFQSCTEFSALLRLAGTGEQLPDSETPALRLLKAWQRHWEERDHAALHLPDAWAAVDALLESDRAGLAKESAKQAVMVAKARMNSKRMSTVRDLALSLEKLGGASFQLNTPDDVDEALSAFLECLDLRRLVRTTFGDTPEVLRDLARSLQNLGDSYHRSWFLSHHPGPTRQSDVQTSNQMYMESLAVHRELHSALGDSPSVLRGLSNAWWNAGLAWGRIYGAAATRGHFIEAERLCRLLRSILGDTPETLRDLFWMLHFIGGTYDGHEPVAPEALEPARRAFSECVELMRQLRQAEGEAPEVLDDLGRSLADLGHLCKRTGDLRAARHFLTEATDLKRATLAVADPLSRYVDLQNLSGDLGVLADIIEKDGNQASARRLRAESGYFRHRADSFGNL